MEAYLLFGVKLTLKHGKEKEAKDILRKADETKPRLKIVKYLDFNSTKNKKTNNNDCNVLVLNIKNFKDDNGRARFFYDDKALEKEKHIY